MSQALLEPLSRPMRQAIESAGYRVARWAAARAVLQARVVKGRMAGALGEFLTHWLVPAPASAGELRLTFRVLPDRIGLVGGSEALVATPLEQALLHLPALRQFWRQELRQRHFAALKAIVPPAWLLDAAAVPPGAVIHGLGIAAWDQLERVRGHDWEMRDSILISRPPAGAEIHACYERNDQAQVLLRSVKASS